MKELNTLESAILKEIIEKNKEKYPFLLLHFPYIKVKSRNYTGVGMYTNFEYSKTIDNSPINTILSSDKYLMIDDLEYVTYVLSITKGKMDYLEIVTNGDETWDGKYKNFRFETKQIVNYQAGAS